MCDLAGSENNKRTGNGGDTAIGKQRMLEVGRPVPPETG